MSLSRYQRRRVQRFYAGFYCWKVVDSNGRHSSILLCSSSKAVSSKFPLVSSRQVPSGVSVSDFGDGVMAPGFVDLHLHGSAGYDVMDDAAEALPAIERLLAQHGVTSYFPTTVTAPMDVTLRALERLADAIEIARTATTELEPEYGWQEPRRPAGNPSRGAIHQSCASWRASARNTCWLPS